ncbi:hypothetical protein BJX64DRAFT_261581 [Aspergillus heterothallicus]
MLGSILTLATGTLTPLSAKCAGYYGGQFWCMISGCHISLVGHLTLRIRDGTSMSSLCPSFPTTVIGYPWTQYLHHRPLSRLVHLPCFLQKYPTFFIAYDPQLT